MQVGIGHAAFLLGISDHLVEIPVIAGAEISHHADPVGDEALCIVVFLQIDKFPRRAGFDVFDDRLVAALRLIGFIEGAVADFEKPHRRFTEPVQRETGVSEREIVPQDIEDASADAGAGIHGQVKFLGEALRLPEAEPDLLLAEKIGVIGDNIPAFLAPHAERPHGIARLDAVCLKVGDHPAQGEDMLRLGSDLLAFLPAHAANLEEPFRFALHDLEGSGTEHADDLLRHLFPDALDNAGCQIALDVLGGVGEHPLAGFRTELQAVGWVGDEAAGQPQAFALLGVSEFARGGHKLVLGFQQQRRIAVLLVAEQDVLNISLDLVDVLFFDGFLRHGCHLLSFRMLCVIWMCISGFSIRQRSRRQ